MGYSPHIEGVSSILCTPLKNFQNLRQVRLCYPWQSICIHNYIIIRHSQYNKLKKRFAYFYYRTLKAILYLSSNSNNNNWGNMDNLDNLNLTNNKFLESKEETDCRVDHNDNFLLTKVLKYLCLFLFSKTYFLSFRTKIYLRDHFGEICFACLSFLSIFIFNILT